MIVKGREVNVDMQRRHLELIAQVINSVGDGRVDRNTLAMLFATKLTKENVNASFNLQRFVAACIEEKQ